MKNINVAILDFSHVRVTKSDEFSARANLPTEVVIYSPTFSANVFLAHTTFLPQAVHTYKTHVMLTSLPLSANILRGADFTPDAIAIAPPSFVRIRWHKHA